jgi:hypothetical protein
VVWFFDNNLALRNALFACCWGLYRIELRPYQLLYFGTGCCTACFVGKVCRVSNGKRRQQVTFHAYAVWIPWCFTVQCHKLLVIACMCQPDTERVWPTGCETVFVSLATARRTCHTTVSVNAPLTPVYVGLPAVVLGQMAVMAPEFRRLCGRLQVTHCKQQCKNASLTVLMKGRYWLRAILPRCQTC